METIATCDAPAWVLRVIAMRALCGVVVHSFDIEAFELTGEERAELEKTGTLRYKGKEKDPFVKKPEPEAAPVKAKTMSMAPKLVTAERLKVPKKERAERVFAIDPRDQPQRVFKSQSEWANK
ncbi:hypothetical protein [Paraburkholderia hospita]|nr:hypothetical protein [Paraburkholderia hospita]